MGLKGYVLCFPKVTKQAIAPRRKSISRLGSGRGPPVSLHRMVSTPGTVVPLLVTLSYKIIHN